MTWQRLNVQFGIPGAAEFEEGEGGLVRLAITAGGSKAQVYLLGGQVTSFVPAGGDDVFWVSDESAFAVGRPIRGGVPVCHPWFGEKADQPGAPLHGFVRLMPFDVESVAQQPDGEVTAVLSSKFGGGQVGWPSDFEVRHRITVGPELTLALETCNCGEEDMTITEALHSYFRVSDVRNVTVTGLAGREYFDKVTGQTGQRQQGQAIAFVGETDRVYRQADGDCVLVDRGLDRQIRVAKSGSNSTVVWNPWAEKARAMADFGGEEWTGMLCVETANALDDVVTIPPGQSHTMRARISVEPIGASAPAGRADEPVVAAAPKSGGEPPDFTTFTARIYVDTPPTKVFEAWTTAEGLSKWLLKAASFQASDEAAPRADGAARGGDALTWTWQSGAVMEGCVLAVEWPPRLAATFGRAGTCEATFLPEGQGTMVQVTQTDLPDAATHIECSNNCTFYLTNLKSVLEGGQDLRETDPGRAGVVNR